MILIITHRTDYTADFVVHKLNRRNLPYIRFNCEDILSYDYTIKFNSNFDYSILGQTTFQSVWFRRTKLPPLDGLTGSDRIYILNEIDSFIKNVFSIIEAQWLSNPYSVYEAENKLLQLKFAQSIGFLIPPTIVSNSKEEIRAFYHEHGGNIIVKPLAQTRIEKKDSISFIFTNKISPINIETLEQYDLTPCIFQKCIDKQYEIRVTVVGEMVFAASVASQSDNETSIDWRRKKLKFQNTELPKEIEKLCVQLVSAMNLRFGAIDIIKTPDNDFVFLEINPNGQWVWIENDTGLKISEAIINELSKKLR